MTLDKLRKYARDNKGKDKVSIVIGYSQSYALEVHERTDVEHKVGQAKYLEEAARINESEIKHSISRVSGNNLAETLLKSGLLIQRASQKLVPVDTSALKASAFTTVEDDLERVTVESRMKAEALRTSVLSEREKSKRKKK